MLRTPVSTTAVPPDLALADDAATLGEGEHGAEQLQVAAAQAAAVPEHAFPPETGGDDTGAAEPFAGALEDQVDLALPAAEAEGDSADVRDGAQPAIEMPFATSSTEVPFAEEAPFAEEVSSAEEAPSSDAPFAEAPSAEVPAAGDAQAEVPQQPSMPAPETADSPASGVAFTSRAGVEAASAGPPGPSAATPLHIAPAAGAPRTLTQAIDTAAKLAADANAAAEALDSLKRLLRQGLPSPTRQPPRAAPGVRSTQPLASAPSLLPKPPPVPATSPRRLPLAPLPAPPPPAEPLRIDVRGFLAGFALSWAIGVVLYLFMTAG
jgi:hypothetical protein